MKQAFSLFLISAWTSFIEMLIPKQLKFITTWSLNLLWHLCPLPSCKWKAQKSFVVAGVFFSLPLSFHLEVVVVVLVGVACFFFSCAVEKWSHYCVNRIQMVFSYNIFITSFCGLLFVWFFCFSFFFSTATAAAALS